MKRSDYLENLLSNGSRKRTLTVHEKRQEESVFVPEPKIKAGRPRTREYTPHMEALEEGNRRRARARYRKLREEGLCVRCGKKMAARWSVYCEECRDKVRGDSAV